MLYVEHRAMIQILVNVLKQCFLKCVSWNTVSMGEGKSSLNNSGKYLNKIIEVTLQQVYSISNTNGLWPSPKVRMQCNIFQMHLTSEPRFVEHPLD